MASSEEKEHFDIHKITHDGAFMFVSYSPTDGRSQVRKRPRTQDDLERESLFFQDTDHMIDPIL